VIQMVPNAVERYQKLVKDLPATLARGVNAARGLLRRLFQEIPVVARGGEVFAVLRLPAPALL